MSTIQHDPPSTQEDTHARVRFQLDDPTLGEVEVLWARLLGADTAKLDNIPLLIFGVSLGDTIRVREDDGWLVYSGVEASGGHSTYRVMLTDPDDAETKERFREIVTRGCSYEQLTPRYLAIDVPPHTDIFEVYGMLERGLDDRIWTFEEGHCGHPVDQPK